MRSAYLDLLSKYGISGAHPGGLSLTRKLLEGLPIDRNTRLVDLGCGTGETLAYIAKTYQCRLVGVDLDDEMLRKAANRFSVENLYINLVRADVAQLPFPSTTFDIALSESVTAFADINRALKEYARILRPGGTLLAIEMTALATLSERELNEIRSVYGVGQIPMGREWADMFRSAGFREIKVHDAKITPAFKIMSLKMLQDFYPHLSILRRYSRKFGYGVFECRL